LRCLIGFTFSLGDRSLRDEARAGARRANAIGTDLPARAASRRAAPGADQPLAGSVHLTTVSRSRACLRQRHAASSPATTSWRTAVGRDCGGVADHSRNGLLVVLQSTR
jgi:hypothetical protein